MAFSTGRSFVWRYINRRILLLTASFLFVLAVLGFLLAVTQSNAFEFAMSVVVLILAGIAYISAPYIEARLLVEQARNLVTAEQFSEALNLLNRASHFAPYLASIYTSRCAAYTGLGHHDLALEDADRSIKLAPRNPTARLVRARLYAHRAYYEDAIHDLRTGIKSNPDWTTGYLELVNLYIRLHDYESSLTLLRELSTRRVSDQSRYEAILLSGWVYEEKLRDLDRAIAAYTRAIPLLPDRKIGYMRRAHAYRMRGDKFQAAEDLLRAAQRLPTPEDAGQYHWIRAACYWGRYTITDDQRDFKAWVAALEQSIIEDAPSFGAQAREWLRALREKRLNRETVQNAMPPMIRIFTN